MKIKQSDATRLVERLKRKATSQGPSGTAATHDLFQVALNATKALGALWAVPKNRYKVVWVAKFFEELPAMYSNPACIAKPYLEEKPDDVARMTKALSSLLPFDLPGSKKRKGRPRRDDLLNDEINRFLKCAWLGFPPMGAVLRVPKRTDTVEGNKAISIFTYFQDMHHKLFTPANLVSQSDFASALTTAFLKYCKDCKPYSLGGEEIHSIAVKRTKQRAANQRAKNDYHFDKPASAENTALREIIRRRLLKLIRLPDTSK